MVPCWDVGVWTAVAWVSVVVTAIVGCGLITIGIAIGSGWGIIGKVVGAAIGAEIGIIPGKNGGGVVFCPPVVAPRVLSRTGALVVWEVTVTELPWFPPNGNGKGDATGPPVTVTVAPAGNPGKEAVWALTDPVDDCEVCEDEAPDPLEESDDVVCCEEEEVTDWDGAETVVVVTNAYATGGVAIRGWAGALVTTDWATGEAIRGPPVMKVWATACPAGGAEIRDALSEVTTVWATGAAAIKGVLVTLVTVVVTAFWAVPLLLAELDVDWVDWADELDPDWELELYCELVLLDPKSEPRLNGWIA